MNSYENNSCHSSGVTITEPIAGVSGIPVPIAEDDQTTSEQHRLDRSVEFAKLVKLVKEQAQAEYANIGIFIDGEFTRASPISRASIDPERRLAFLKHIEGVLHEAQFQLPMKEESHQRNTTKSWISFPDDLI